MLGIIRITLVQLTYFSYMFDALVYTYKYSMPKEHIVEKSPYCLLELYEICWETIYAYLILIDE